MHIGIISDTHDHQRNVARAIDLFKERDVQYVLHAGDIVTAPMVQGFAERWRERVFAVVGNCDADRASLQATVERCGGRIDNCYEGDIDGKAIHMTHTPQKLAQAVGRQQYDLVVYGHTHRHDIRREGKTLIVNPGAARGGMIRAGQVVVLDLADMTHIAETLD